MPVCKLVRPAGWELLLAVAARQNGRAFHSPPWSSKGSRAISRIIAKRQFAQDTVPVNSEGNGPMLQRQVQRERMENYSFSKTNLGVLFF
jgi:hypothetical protein